MSDQLRELSGTTYERLRVRDARFAWVDVGDAHVWHGGLRRVRLRGVELQDVEIDGEISNVTVNGIDIAPLIEAEMARQDPDYAKMSPSTADGFREAWDVLERRWVETVARAQQLDPALLHERVDGEWSFVETLRHLCYATDAWVNRVYLGDPDPWSPLDLPFDTMRDLEWRHDTDVRPTLDEVLALRASRQAAVRRSLDGLTDDDLAGETTPVEGEGWPPPDAYPVAEVFGVVVNEEWHHRRYAERDLAVLESRA
jgi:uncharacterized damage-inducible protein DinB